MNRANVLSSHLTPKRGRGVLDGVKVVELATIIAAPACAALMADMGADVVKVERPGGDPWRSDRAAKTPDTDYGGPHFAQDNRGKRSIVLDIEQPAHLEALKKLISQADVFISNVRVKSLQKKGLDYESLRVRNPRLIMALNTAWGLAGPKANDAGYDVGAFWAASGLQDFTKPTDDGHVGQFPPGIGDHLTASQILSGVALALYDRERTGKGQMIEAALLRSGVYGMAYPIMNTKTNPGGKFIREPRTNHYRPTFNVYKCKDGTWLQLLGLDLGRWDRKLCEVLGLDFKDVEPLDNPARIAVFDKVFLTRPADEWEQRLNAKGVWYQRSLRCDEILDCPQVNAIGTFAHVPGVPHALITNPMQMSGHGEGAHVPVAPPPACGAHTVEVLTEAGYSDTQAQAIDEGTKKWSRATALSD